MKEKKRYAKRFNLPAKRMLLLLVSFILVTSIFAQESVITGVIMDESGEPLIGATVAIEGTSKGTTTDLNGKYSLSVPQNATLVFTFVGYLPQKVAVAGQSLINVKLKSDVKKLDEIVVVGYGTQRKKDVTGSIVSVNNEGIRENASSNLSQSLQGKVAGVEMTQTSSRPGSEMQIRIRGSRSLTASNDPLVVLDGIPFAGSLSDINTSDIKSVDILKDASSTAIYGSRGANGVILITTFRGESELSKDPVITYNGYYGFKKLMNPFPMMDAKEFITWRKEAIKNGASYTNGADEDTTLNTDWQKLMFQTGRVTSHDISLSNGTKGGGFSFGAGYYDETTVLPGQEYKRYSLRGSFDQKIGKRIKVGLSTITTYGITEGGKDNPLGGILSLTPITNPYNADGSIKTDKMYINNMDTYYNPLMIETLGDRWKDEQKTFASYNSFYGEIEFIEGLKYHFNLGLNYRQSNYGDFKAANTFFNADAVSYASIENKLTTNWVAENLLYYDKTFAEKHKLSLVAMFSAEQTESNTSNVSVSDVTADYLQYYNLGLLNDEGIVTINPNNQSFYERGLISEMFRANYSFDNKYLVTATIRSDASSVLAEGHRKHTYPAVSLGWNASNEEFMKSLSWLNYLKPRLGFGQTSNQAINPYQTMGGLSTNYYNFGDKNVSGYYVSSLPNLNLGWEYSTTWNYGLDFGFLDSRITGTFEYYYQKTTDVLVAKSLAATSGATETFMTNMGKTQNKGLELSLNISVIKSLNNWNWDIGFNIYSNKNEILELASGDTYDKGNGWFVGQPIDAIYDFKKLGIWQLGEEDQVKQYEGSTGKVGMIKVKYNGDYNTDGSPTRVIGTGTTLEKDDREILGSVDPDFQGGFNTKVSYKGFELSAIGNYRKGGILVSALHSPTSYLNMNNGRRGQIKIDYWTETNPTNAYPKPYGPEVTNNPKYGSTLAYFDGSFVKITNITLAYTFKNEWLKKAHVNNLRMYLTAQNPFIFASDYYSETKLDPQPNSKSSDTSNQSVVPSNSDAAVKSRINVVGYNTPATRNYLFGVNVSF
jgi:TonB-dependent starch-binding outer membrane protein SusC